MEIDKHHERTLHHHEHHEHHEHHSDGVCHQCGKIHSVFFIKEHHCLEETLSTFFRHLIEQSTPVPFQTRAPPSI